jgi:cytochrome c-type biogenesis protein CcmF
MGEPLDDGAWAVRLQYKPLIRWIWLGAIFIGCGGLVTALDRRYRALTTAASVAEGAHAPA